MSITAAFMCRLKTSICAVELNLNVKYFLDFFEQYGMHRYVVLSQLKRPTWFSPQNEILLPAIETKSP